MTLEQCDEILPFLFFISFVVKLSEIVYIRIVYFANKNTYFIGIPFKIINDCSALSMPIDKRAKNST